MLILISIVFYMIYSKFEFIIFVFYIFSYFPFIYFSIFGKFYLVARRPMLYIFNITSGSQLSQVHCLGSRAGVIDKACPSGYSQTTEDLSNDNEQVSNSITSSTACANLCNSGCAAFEYKQSENKCKTKQSYSKKGRLATDSISCIKAMMFSI